MHFEFHHTLPSLEDVSFTDFLKIDIRIGTVISCEPHRKAKKPAYIIKVDFGGTIGIKTSSAQVTVNYKPEELLDRQVAAVVNFPPRNVGPVKSEVLILGFADEAGEIVLFSPDKKVPNGSRLL